MVIKIDVIYDDIRLMTAIRLFRIGSTCYKVTHAKRPFMKALQKHALLTYRKFFSPTKERKENSSAESRSGLLLPARS